MELGAEASSLEKAKNLFVSVLDGFLLAIGYWLCVNGVAVVVVKDKDVVVAADGWHDKATCLIRTDVSCHGLTLGVDMVSAMPWSFLIGRLYWL